MTEYIAIDGSRGEGGGQILRSSLSLAMATGKPLRISNIRSGRAKPGLMRQHLTSVRAAKEICGATVRGDAIGSTELEFSPGPVRGGKYDFAIGTAGSSILVLQTILPALILAPEPSVVTVEGGTHNPQAPCFDFLDRCWTPAINAMGPTVSARIESYGFYPVGGGRVVVSVEPASELGCLELLEREADRAVTARICTARLPQDICQREVKSLQKRLKISGDACTVDTDIPSPGCGNYLFLELKGKSPVPAGFTGLGKLGLAAEKVARRTAGRARTFMLTGAPVERHLADQLLLPMALAGKGAFLTEEPTEHTLTNIGVIKAFLDLPISVEQENEHIWRISVGQGYAS